MRIILARPRGFCAGVNMAIESLELAIEAVRHADLRLSRDRPQPSGWSSGFAARGSCSSTIWPKCPRGRTCSTRPTASRPRSAGWRPSGAEDHRRHLPAGDQGPSGGHPLCPAGLHDRADRPRRARRSGGHDGRGARGDPCWCGSADDVDRLEVADPQKSGLSHADHPVGRRRGRGSSPGCGSGFPQIVGPRKDDICYATQNRQEAVRELAARGRRGAGRRQPEQLEQPAAGRAGPRVRRASRI